MCMNWILKCVQMFYCDDGTCGVPIHVAGLITCEEYINRLSPELFFFLILAHSVYKMWIKQEPNTLELWNKLHFEEKETKSIYRV